MSAPASVASSIGSAMALLQSELAQLEEHQKVLQSQQQSIQAELALVSGNIESIRGALAALRSVPPAVVPRPSSGEEDQRTSPNAKEPDAPQPAPAASVQPAETLTATESAHVQPSGDPVAPEEKATNSDRHVGPSLTALSKGVSRGSRFTEQVIAVLARNPDIALRARDVAEALGRDESAGSINAVRSTLDRLVATSRARRAGRGLYQAPAE
ncbi:hypothetical protein [Streptomyces sp. NPDC052721]|uniref:hypothetical protein n=1 Tax=Streptomyces sp. NPDC052721 TaxID=3154955 RepID=UPI0034363A74